MQETPIENSGPDSLGPEGPAWLIWLRRYRTAVMAAVSLLVFAVVVVAVYRVTGDIRYDDVLAALQATPIWGLIAAGALTVVSFGFLTLYDFNALRHIGRPLPIGQVIAISFSSYAVGNTAGFGALSGGAIRYRGYSRLGLTTEEVTRVVAFVSLAFGLGVTILTAVALLFFAGKVADLAGLTEQELRLIALASLAGFAGAGFWLWRRRPALAGTLPDLRTCLVQLAVTAADLAAAASVLYVLLPAGLQVHWPSFVALYAIAVGLGVLSHVPAGLGVFEAVMIAAVGRDGATEAVVGSLVLYRLIYHVLPLVLAVLLVLWAEVLQFRHSPVARWAQRLGGLLAPSLLATLSLICGVMLIFSAVLPTPAADLDWLSGVIPIELLEAAHFMSSLLGLGLMIAARGLAHRLDGAYWAALLAAVLALAFAFVKAIAPYEAITLVVLIVALVISRKIFTRRASLFSAAMTPRWIAAIGVIVASAVAILLFAYRDVEYSSALWWQFEFSGEAPRGLRAALGLIIAAAVVALYSLLRPARPRPAPASAEDMARAIAILRLQDDGDANLVRMGDKSLMFAESGDAFLMYGVQGQSWISLFGPIGAREAHAGLIWSFVEAAHAAGGRAVIYQAAPELLPLCADAGLRGLKLGEMATVELADFDLQTPRRAEQRQAIRRGERDGMTFAILHPGPEVADVLDDLERVSDDWLADHQAREKGFALGRFDRSYVVQQPVAVLRKDGRIVAFASVMVTDTRAEATLDLMRFGTDAPRGAMDYLFANLLAETKRLGYQRFNLGMAPLAGIATHASAPVWNHVGQTVFEHGERYYNFKGLRAFKAKFHPMWQPRYLVIENGVSPMAALFDVTRRIGGGLKGVVGK